MDPEAAREFLRGNHRAVLVTQRRNGGAQTSPVAVAVDDAGFVIVSTRETALKVKNLERIPEATICAFSDSFYGPWVQVDGTVDIVRLPLAMEPLEQYYRSVSGEHPDWDDYRRAMEAERRVLLRLTITGAGPDRSG